MVTVVTFLEEHGALSLLEDARVLIATRDITDRGGRRTREEVGAILIEWWMLLLVGCLPCVVVGEFTMRWGVRNAMRHIESLPSFIPCLIALHRIACPCFLANPLLLFPIYLFPGNQVAADVARKQRAAKELKAAFAGPSAGFNLTGQK